jgi:hypothetical protein
MTKSSMARWCTDSGLIRRRAIAHDRRAVAIGDDRLEIRIGDLDVGVIGRDDFVANKTACGRPKDLMDLTLLPPA